MSKAERKLSVSYADAQKRSSYEETPEGRPARRRAEEKDASDESTVLEVFLHCIALKVCQTMAKLQAFCPAKERRRPHLENCTGKESKQTLRRVAVKPSKKS